MLMRLNVQENFNGFLLSLLSDQEKAIKELESKFVHEDTLIRRVVKINQELSEIKSSINNLQEQINELKQPKEET
jgi:predicted transcriptional regulator